MAAVSFSPSLWLILPFSEPSWKPQLPGPFPLSELRAHLSSADVEHPAFGDKFHFYHADLGPTNIMVSDDGHVNGILDWEYAAFYPLFCVSTKPFISACFFLKGADDRKAWSMLWTDALPC
jgi:Phosphotransferase enzyme family